MMLRVRTTLAAAGLGVSLLAPVAIAGTASAGSANTAQQAGGHEFVVAVDTAAPEAGLASIADAGGTVVDVNESLGLVLVSAADGFIAEVSGDAGIEGAAQNHSVGSVQPNQGHMVATDRLTVVEGQRGAAPAASQPGQGGGRSADPLADLQWDMAAIGATADGAHRRATGDGVTVGIIDTGIDASHPDIAPNFSNELSRNFTMDIPSVDGPCEFATCIDPANVDHGGHGTHVAGIVGAAHNGIGITGVAPDVTLVNLRAGQDSGFFFVFETVAALTEAGDLGLDVVNMSFFTDPWLYNCASLADYISGPVTPEQIAEQAFIRQTVLAATEYAHDHGVTLVAAAGNSHHNLALPTRHDTISPDFPGGTEVDRVVTNNCLDLPSEGPDVISVSSTGPSGTKSDFSNYGLGDVEVAAPGGWFRDFVGTPAFMTPANLILSSYPLDLAIDEGLANPDGTPTDDFSESDCSVSPCAFYTRLQGTSMASPHAAGVAALIVQAHGRGNPHRGFSLAPDQVRTILETTATDHACPAGGVEIYTDEGRPAEFNAICEGTTAENGLYGEGIVNAAAAVARRR
jgi:lantibiotic leader peptide-processing serine protease